MQTTSVALLDAARNYFASKVIADGTYTHILFIDSDMGFSPNLIARLIDFDKPFVGAICPYRTLNFGRFYEAARGNESVGRAIAASLEYVTSDALIPEDTQSGKPVFRVSKGFVRMRQIGTGLVLVKREVFVALKDRFPELWVEASAPHYRGMGLQTGVLQCFAMMQGKDGVFLGEDESFCDRWINGCGGEIWGCVDEYVTHVGQMAFKGRYIDRLKR